MTDAHLVDVPNQFTLLTLTNGRGSQSWRTLTARWQYELRAPYLELSGLSDVSQARSAIASQWMAEHTTPWAIWLDDDMVVPIEALVHFCAQALAHADDLDLLCGVYAPKRPAAGSVCVLFTEDRNTLGLGGGIVPVSGCGFGCVAVKRTVFDRIALDTPAVRYEQVGVIGRPYFLGMVTSAPEDPDGALRHAGEDFAFCARALKAGARMFCDTRLRLGHHGGYTYNWEDAGTRVELVDRIDLGRKRATPMRLTEED